MDMTYAIFVTLMGWLLGGFINGIVGFGAALVAMPIVALGLDMRIAVPTCGLVVLALNFQMAWSYRAHLDTTGLGALILGALPGAVTGILFLRYFSEAWLKMGLGLLLAVYALWGLVSVQPHARQLALGWGGLAGFLSTSLGTSFGFNGPPLAVYLSLRGGTQQQIKAALGVFLIVSSLFIVAAHGLSGLYTGQALLLFVVALPAVIFGARSGIYLSSRVGEGQFRRMLFAMILVMGLNMFWTAWST